MLTDLVVGSALLLFGALLYLWWRSPALRMRIERPKHVFLQQARAHDDASHLPVAELAKRDKVQ